MKTLEESKKARAIEKIYAIPLPLSQEGYRKLMDISYIGMSPSDESFPEEYRNDINRILRERNKAYQAKLARGEVKVPF